MDFVEPDGGGIRLLTLDGGDAHGISQLIILRALMARLEHDLGRVVRPCEYFDHITGVGSSGVIAILLGVLQMAADEALRNFCLICFNVFPPEDLTDEERSQRLINIFEEILDQVNIDRDERLRRERGPRCRVSLCYSSGDLRVCHMFRNYELRGADTDLSIIEAVASVWATPGLFSPVKMGPVYMQQTITSAVYGYNNPTTEAIKEAHAVFGNGARVSLLLSLGSGRRPPAAGFSERTVRTLVTDIEAESNQRRFGKLPVYFRFSYEGNVEGNNSSDILSQARNYLQSIVIQERLDAVLKIASLQGDSSTTRLCRVSCVHGLSLTVFQIW